MKKFTLHAVATALLVAVASPALAHNGPHGPHNGSMIKVKGYSMEFVEKNDGTKGTISLYITDAKKAHVATGDVSVDITAADGHKLTTSLKPDGDHFSGAMELEDMGGYKALVKYKQEKTRLNGRFEFTRKS
jgi:hypothetical protein